MNIQNRTEKNRMDQVRLYQWINLTSFAVNDIVLYLDTHPEDQMAIAYFNHFRNQREEAMREYADKFGPLTIDTAMPVDQWTWWEGLMPWEGGAC